MSSGFGTGPAGGADDQPVTGAQRHIQVRSQASLGRGSCLTLTIEQRDVIVRILTHLGLPTELVSLRPARPPPSRQGAWVIAGQQTLDSCAPPPTRASDPDLWELGDELVEEEDYSQAEAW